MDLIRIIARPMLGGLFVASGINHVKSPEHGAEVAQQAADNVLEPMGVETDGQTLMKAHGYVSVVAGAGLALGIAPRLCALALAADVTAVNLTANRFWEQDGEQRQGTQIQFMKDLAIAGGLLIAAADTAGKPGLGYRAQMLADQASARADHASTIAGLKKDIAKLQAENKGLAAKASLAAQAGKASGAAGLLGTQAKAGAKTAKVGGRGSMKAFAAKKRKDSMMDRFTDAVDDAVKQAKKTVNA
ncbi:Uncharacterized membrane protein YphA, DoxX/SURF4 family [Kytococcus aerolatus]|uniref:Uncharacterized membrane protein YphA, DoxX/SURF4 family n=1 Tax=Kytococcus aerolatus TaxID=592308 RepID=A0A212T7A5_9MICO|nr:DoxX family protein [Kytococcus aerolatus]SNC61875.1 Uncharacterized membrane protein YphA, DoxX/SURF4 family [Kytococcus aerolatus]